MSIPIIQPIAVTPKPLTGRLWELFALSAEGKATPAHKRELDALCKSLETEQDR